MPMMNQKYGKLLNTTEDIRWVQTEPFCFDFIKEGDGITDITPGGSFLEGITLGQEHIYIFMTRPMKLYKGVGHFNTDIVVVGDSVENDVNTDELVHTARSSSACFPVFQCTLSAA